ncbi:MAG TPA: aldehyde dehydrogenase family protein, partial [Rhodospirillum rubrum]|nr:aldehyde dehydrogenase family protein [Rhodospirillum rubrum]
RCTTLRRVIVHESIAADLIGRLAAAYASIRVGNPLEAGTLVGPLIHGAAQEAMETALARAKADGGIVHGGERVMLPGSEGSYTHL